MQAFEVVYGIIINLDKTEMYDIHTNQIDNLDAFVPIKYLGLPLHERKLTLGDWKFLTDKLEKKLQNLKGQLLSIGGDIL